jgi:hypothetical protein
MPPSKKWKAAPASIGGKLLNYLLDLRLQTGALVAKNVRLLRRSLKTSALTVIVPFAFVALLFIVI